MPASKLAIIFGNSIAGHSSPILNDFEKKCEFNTQQMIVENLFKIPSSFYMSFVEIDF